MEMRKMEELKMKLLRDLETAAAKNPLTASDINIIDTLLHSIKNLCKVMEAEEQGESHAGYSGRHYVRGHYSRDSYGNGYAEEAHGGSSYNGSSYGRESYGEHPKEMREMLEHEYSKALDPKEREVIRRMIDKF